MFEIEEMPNSMGNEILTFMHRIFANCTIQHKYYEVDNAWRFNVSFDTSHTRSYHINPPQGCCLMKVYQVGAVVSFEIILFVSDFIKYHAHQILN